MSIRPDAARRCARAILGEDASDLMVDLAASHIVNTVRMDELLQDIENAAEADVKVVPLRRETRSGT